ncbi:hypothetical protein [Actinacidiphila rubida]|uniref:Uncharacterized protein n=1 Tax=Actinacidiphila rubida TaxID=310780 RepID=A0A1H8ECW3_9ACTN|nr:hypothetical protein [Actinacidiphila rubida]SEN16667.1 hypothetical protein SAMN05216267_1002110 [Actinacidiphila rubida]
MSRRTLHGHDAVAGGRRAASSSAALRLPLALVVAVTLGACSAGRPPASTSGSPPSPTSPPTATATATQSVPASSPPTLVLDEHARLTTVTVPTGSTVIVRLHSTYWSTPSTSDPAVLAPHGGGSSPAGSCPPGGGCGVSTARFSAARPGTARITAHRTSCGEARRCPPGQTAYAVTVTVTR